MKNTYLSIMLLLSMCAVMFGNLAVPIGDMVAHAQPADQLLAASSFDVFGPGSPAETPTTPTGSPAETPSFIRNPLKAESIQCLVVNILNLVSTLGAIVVALMVIYSGYKFVVARGNPKEIEEAKRALLYTLIGALILLGAVVIANVLAATVNQVVGPGTAVPSVNPNSC